MEDLYNKVQLEDQINKTGVTCLRYANSAEAIDTTSPIIGFDAAIIVGVDGEDLLSTGWDKTTNSFYAPTSGLYLVNAHITTPSNTGRRFMTILKNGVDYARGIDSTGAFFSTSVTALVPLYPDDYIQINCYNSSVSTTSGTGVHHNYLHITRIGDIIEN